MEQSTRAVIELSGSNKTYFAEQHVTTISRVERDQQIARLNDLLAQKDAELAAAKKQADAALVALGKVCARCRCYIPN